MEKKDFLKLRARIHDELKKWFSYSTKYRILYSDWIASKSDLDRLYDFVKPYGLNVYFDGNSVIIG